MKYLNNDEDDAVDEDNIGTGMTASAKSQKQKKAKHGKHAKGHDPTDDSDLLQENDILACDVVSQFITFTALRQRRFVL